MVFGRTGFENQLIDWLKLEIKLGSRPHFKLISYEETLSLIESYGKQKGDGFQEFLSSLEDILFAAKSELNETGQLSVTMLSKLIKLQIYIFKLENDPALKNDTNKLNKPPEKEIKGSGKQKEVPKSKQTSSVNLFEPVRKGSVLQSRAKDYASLESDELNAGAQLYILLFGFINCNLLYELEKVGIIVDTIIRIQVDIDGSSDFLPIDCEKYEVGLESHYLTEDKAKIELKTEQLNKFWDNLNKILNYCESTVCFDNLIVQDLNIMNQSIPSVLCPREMQENFKSNLYSSLAKLMFNVQTLKRQHLNYLEHLNIIHVPTYTEQIEAYQKKLLEAGIEFDTSTINIKFPKRNYYESSLNKMPSECNTVPVILHFIVEQVVKIVEDDNECLHDIMEINEEDINSKEINDIFEDWQYKLCLKEFQPDEEVFVPIIINHGDNSSLMFQGCSENLKTQLTTIHNQLLHMHPVIQMLKKFPLISEHLRHKISAAYHQFYSLFQEHEISIAEIERVLKWVTFENMKLLTVCDDGTIVKGCQTYSVCKNLFKIYQEGDEQLNFSFAMIPVSSSYCNDGYILLCNKAVNQMQYNGIVSNFTIPRCFQTCPLTNRNSKKNVICECFNISNLPISCECGKSLKPEYSHNNRKNTVPTKNNVKNIPNVFDNVVNVNNYLYAEILNSNVLFQILYEAMEVFHCVDFFYYEQDHCYLAVFHNPCNSSHFNHTNWNVKLNSNIAVRNFQMHVLDSIKEWIEKEEEIFQSKEKKSEIQDVASVVTFPSTVEANRNEEWIPKIILESLKYQKHDSKSSIGVSLQTNEQIIKIARDQHIIKETQKKRTEILGTITEQFIETPSVEYAFNGYDLGNIMLHINGSTTHLFLADNGIISIEKYKYLYGRNRIKINVLHNNDELFIFPPVVSSDFDCLPAQFHAILSKDIRVTQVLKQHTVPLLTNDETHSSTEKASIDEQNLEINSGKDSSKFFTVKEEERTRMLLEVYITLASGLVVHIKRSDDDNPESKFIVRQMYFGECCEIKEWCRTITVDGTVIRTLKGNISQALKLDGTILTTNWSSRESLLKDETIFEKKKNIETASIQNVEIMEMEEQKNEINEAENVDDNNEPIWVCTFPDGVQCQLQKGKNNIPLEPILANIAIKPRTKEKYIIRDDDLQFAQSPNHYSIVHFPDGTRTTVHHKATDPKNMETIEIEHPKFIGVTINCVTGIFYLHILPDVTVTVKPNGHILYQHDSGMQIAFNTDGTALYTSKDKCGVCQARPFNTYIISPTNPICLEAYDCEGQKIEVQANGNYTMAKTKPKELIPNKKRYFVVYEDGSGMELLNEMEMDSVLEKTLNDPMTDVQVHNLPNDCFTQGVIIFHPLTRSSSDIWGISQNVPYKMDSIVPSGLTCNDLKPVVPDNKDFNYPFGFHVGNGLNIGSVKKQEKVPSPVCNDPELWIIHHYLKYRKLTPYLKRTFENKLEEFFLMKEYLCRQSIQAQVTEFRDANEQKLARSLLELAKATGHPQKCMRTSPMNGVTSDKEILEKKPSKRNNLQRSHSKKLAEIKAEIKEWQHNQKLLSQKNFPPYFHSQLRASQQMKIQPNMPKKKSSQSDKDVRLDKKEKTFPLLSVRKTINSFSADRFITSRFLKPKLLQQSAKSSQQKSSPQQIHEPYPTFDKGVLVQEVDEGQPCLNCKDRCSGFTPHVWRKVCNNCKCPREAHDVYHEEFVNVRDRLGFRGQSDPNKNVSKERSVQEGYSWVPPGLNSDKIEEYFNQLPNHKVPRIGTPGEKYRDKQLMLQLPKQDLALAYCKHVDSIYQKSFEDFVNARNEIALDIGYVRDHIIQTAECHKCHGVMQAGDVAVIAPKFGENVCWHPACFTCTTCDELLVDLTYCINNGLLYCERHYAETLKARCAACDELIFSGEYTKGMNKDWHTTHFCCWQCDESLTGQRYVLRDEHPYCIKCYEQVFANQCEECGKVIGIDSKDLSYKEKHWHEACFLCSKCRVSLVDKPFGSKNEKVYCANCYDAAFATRCDGCGEIFRAGTKKMEYKGRQWHEKCFCCCVCKTPIGTKSFIPRDNDIYCAGCYEERFATRCIKCNKIITTGGVTYKNDPWHRECFTCTHCNTSLAGQRFTSRDDKPYCADCFGELFAKRCTACGRPITGIGGTRFISFEDRHWHNDCFICAMCKGSLVGKGFITDGADILCPECAKQKLM